LRMTVAKNGMRLKGFGLERSGYVCEEGLGGCDAWY
jgi:hypothetical protein